MELKGKKINFLGDSITQGCGTSTEDYRNRFSNLIEKNEGAVCRNYGIGGTRIAKQTAVSADPIWDRDFCSRVAEMDPDADIVVVFGGTNDYGHGDAPFGSFADRDNSTFCGALHVLFTSLIEKYPTAQIVILTPLHRGAETVTKKEFGCTEEAVALKDYVNAIREAAEYYSLPMLDLFATSGWQPEIPVIRDTFMPDQLHPNDAGHVVLAEKITAFLKAM